MNQHIDKSLGFFAETKVLLNRGSSYLVILNFIMVGSLVVNTYGWRWWYILLIPLLVGLLFVDRKWIHGKEQDIIFSRSEYMRMIRKNIKEKL